MPEFLHSGMVCTCCKACTNSSQVIMDNLNTKSSTSATPGTGSGDRAPAHGHYEARYYENGELIWSESYDNLVTDVGALDMLDKYFSGSAYTAVHYIGLISAVSYTSAPVVGDTMSSHSGWTEAGGTNAPAFSQTARPAISWAAASGTGAGSRTKSMATSATFNFTGAGTVKGSIVTTSSTKDGTTGTLVSAGLFTGGDQPVTNGGTLTVSYQLSI